MRRLLFSKELPYILTALLGIIGIQANYLIKGITESPNIECKYYVQKDIIQNHARYREMVYEIRNISSHTSFKELCFDFAFANHIKARPLIIDDSLKPFIHTFSPSSIISADDATSIGGDIARFYIKKFQPGYHYILRFNTKTNESVTEYPKVFLTSEEPVQLLEPSLTTFIGKHLLGVNVCFFFACIGIAALYLFKINTHKKSHK